VMTLTLTADHRAVDGAMAARFLQTVKGLLEEPVSMLL
jgi:pyruvate dehydrogenase E2 component (dihydrolipoamide acetyltransferase)